MHPVLMSFSAGQTEIVVRSYSFFMVLAWITSLSVGAVSARLRGLSGRRALLTYGIALAAGVLGARLLDLGVNWHYYAEESGRIYSLGFSGFSLYGGLILALVAGCMLSRVFQLPLWRLADSAVPALAAGIILMRTGCLLNGCCFGAVTSSFLGVTYPVGSQAWAFQVARGEGGLSVLAGATKPVHPTQVYEMAAAALLGGLAVWLLVRGRPGEPGERGSRGASALEGLPFLVFALGFTLFRLGNNFLRAQAVSLAVPVWFYPTFYATIALAIVSVLAWRISRFRPGVDYAPGLD